MTRFEREYYQNLWFTRFYLCLLTCVVCAVMLPWSRWFLVPLVGLYLLAGWCLWEYGTVPQVDEEKGDG